MGMIDRPSLDFADADESYFYPIILENIHKDWKKVAHTGATKIFPAKSVISRISPLHDSNNCLFFIQKGMIRLSHISYSGREKMMLYMGKDTLFNECPVFCPRINSGYFFTAIETTTVASFSKSVVIKGEYPGLSLNVIQGLAFKNIIFYNQLSSVWRSSFSHICRILYSMHLHQRIDGIIVPRLSQTELAAYLGLHRASLHKALLRLKREGIIGGYSRESLEVHKPPALRLYAMEQ